MKKTKIIVFSCLAAFILIQVFLILIFNFSLTQKVSYEYEKTVLANTQNVAAQLNDGTDIKDVQRYNLANVFVVTRDGFIQDKSAPFATERLTDIWDIDIDALFQDDAIFGKGAFDGKTYLTVAVQYTADLKLVVLQDYYFVEDFAKNETAKLIAIAVFQILLSCALIVLCVKYYIRSSDLFNFANKESKNYYILKLDRYGTIKSSSNAFKQNFDVENLSMYTVDLNVSLAAALESLQIIHLRLTNSNKQEVYFLCSPCKVLNGYKVIAIDNSFYYKNAQDITSQIYTDVTTGVLNINALQNDFGKIINNQQKLNLSLSVFELKNLNNLLLLFGHETHIKILKKCVEIFKQKFGKEFQFYFIEMTKFVVLTDDASMTEKIKSQFVEFNEMLNLPIQIDSNFIQVQSFACNLSFSNVDKAMSIEELLQYGEFLINNLIKSKSSNVVSQIYTRSKYNFSIGAKKIFVKKVIEEGLLDLYFQPQVSLKDDKIVSFESLVRLNKEDTIELSTQEFIILAETNGYMVQLGNIIYDKAFEFASQIKGTGIEVGINISPIQLMQVGFVESFLKKYRSYNLAPNSISIEITETFIMQNIDENIIKLKILKDNNISVHLDDFGMGFSSLSYLKRLPIDVIKIDKEFVDDICDNKFSRSIANIVVETCHDLGLKSIAEGVETNEQKASLKELKCDIIQGYLTGRAVDINTAKSMVDTQIATNKQKG